MTAKPVPLVARLRVTGGIAHIPGLAIERHLDGNVIDAAVRVAIEEAIERSRFFDRPDETANQACDGRSYELWLRLGDSARSMTIREPIEDAELANLVSLVRRQCIPN